MVIIVCAVCKLIGVKGGRCDRRSDQSRSLCADLKNSFSHHLTAFLPGFVHFVKV